MPSGSPVSVSIIVRTPIAAASAAATRALFSRPRWTAKKLVASSTSASAAAGDIGAKSAPRSRRAGTPSTQPQIAAGPSAATMPKAARERRASLSRSVVELRIRAQPSRATSAFLSAEWLRPRRHARPVAEGRRLRMVLFPYLGEKVLRHRDRRAELRLNEPGDAGHRQARERAALRLLFGVAREPGAALLVLALDAAGRQKSEHRGAREHPWRTERAQRLAAGGARGRFDAVGSLGDALLDFVDILIRRNHCGGSGSRPRSCRRSAVNGSSLASVMVNQASTAAAIRFSTAAMASAIGHEAPWPQANTIAAATRPIHEVTMSTAATSTQPRIQASRIAARRASRTVSSA